MACFWKCHSLVFIHRLFSFPVLAICLSRCPCSLLLCSCMIALPWIPTLSTNPGRAEFTPQTEDTQSSWKHCWKSPPTYVRAPWRPRINFWSIFFFLNLVCTWWGCSCQLDKWERTTARCEVQGASASMGIPGAIANRNSKSNSSFTGMAAISTTVTQDESLGGLLHSHSAVKNS